MRKFVLAFIALNVLILFQMSVSEPVSAATSSASEKPLYRQVLGSEYFTCKADSDCKIVSGWCSYFAINKNKLDSFHKLPDNSEDPKGKNPTNSCPPGWVPKVTPKSICLKSECSTK